MLDACGNDHHVARLQAPCRLAPLLIPTTARNTQKQLPAAAFRMMNMPVIAATGLKGHVCHKRNARYARGERMEIRFADEILRIRRIFIAQTEGILLFKFAVFLH